MVDAVLVWLGVIAELRKPLVEARAALDSILDREVA